ncbi:MAG: serine/threonine-protein kinase [Bacteroidota bacterium]
MENTRWQQLQHWFEAALKLPAAEREAYLSNQCADQPGMAQEVLELLQADASEDSLLSNIVLPQLDLQELLHPMEGQILGPYQVEKVLGKGGMGTVYLARRIDGEFDQLVAVKLLKRGMDSEELFQRFRIERQIQARLEHPHIARLLDGGLTADGQPYFTMEYVPGLPLGEYCNRHLLSIDQRLGIFLQICEAIQYAHSQLVIHRDLKPNNILVNEEGTVKLLDFGIARLMDEDQASGLTQDGNRVFTPEYASPEQAQGKSVGTATDVYSLGVIVYELLTGLRPFDLADLSPVERELIITKERPPLPSQRVVELPSDKLAGRDGSIDRLSKHLKGDLDTICLKALRKEAERRYTSAGEFAEDIRNYLHHQPVKARPDTFVYRSKKFIQRNRVAVTASLLASLLFLFTISFYTWQVGNERDRAQLEAQKSKEIADFLTEIFMESNPIVNQGDTLTAMQLLDRGAKKIKTELEDNPQLKREMLALLGSLYREMGNSSSSLHMYDAALDIAPDEHAISDAFIFNRMATQAIHNGYLEEADSLLGEAQQALIAEGDFPNRDWGEWYNTKGNLHLETRQLDSAETAYLSALHVFQDIYSGPDPNIAGTFQSLGLLYSISFQADKAVDYLHRSLSMAKHIETEEGIGYRKPMLFQSLARAYSKTGDFDTAIAYADSALLLFRKSYGNEHPLLGGYLRVKAILLADSGKSEEAKALLEECLALNQKLYGPTHENLASVLSDLGTISTDQNDPVGAEAYFRQSLSMRGENSPPQGLAINKSLLAGAVEKQGRYTEAETLYMESLALDRETYGNVHPYIADGLNNIGQMWEDLGETEKAMAYYEEALALVDSGLSLQNPYISTSFLLKGRLLTKQGALEEAYPLLVQGLGLREDILPPINPHIATGQRMLAECLMKQKQYATADSLLQRSLAIAEEAVGVDHEVTESTKRAIRELEELRKEKSP